MRREDYDAFKYFDANEFENPEKMSRVLISLLDRARDIAGIPFVINSSYRQSDPLSHGDGDAVDIKAEDSAARMRIVRSLLTAGFSRVGVYPRHVHADVSVRLPSDVFWIGDYDGAES